MTIIESFILGIVEGLSEFLPISSTFHLLIAKDLLNITDAITIDNMIVIIQSGAILAAVFLYAKRILTNVKLMKVLIFSFIPTAIVGYLGNEFIKSFLFLNLSVQIFSFMIVGGLFLLTEYFHKPSDQPKTTNDLTIPTALLVGLMQSLAVIPGVSRSGAVLLIMLWLGYSRSEAAEYSFMVGIPTIMAASAFDMLDLAQANVAWGMVLPQLLVGWGISFIVALFAMKWLIKYLQTKTLNVFGVYRLVLGAVLLLILWF